MTDTDRKDDNIAYDFYADWYWHRYKYYDFYYTLGTLGTKEHKDYNNELWC